MKKFALFLMFLASAALLKADTVQVTVVSSPPEGGATVPKSGATYPEEANMELALVATPADLYDFGYWQIDGDATFADGTKTATKATATMIPTGQATVTAYFVRHVSTSEIVVYDWYATGRRFDGASNGKFNQVTYPVYGWLVLSFDPSLNVFSGGQLISFWTLNKNKFWQTSNIDASIDVIPEANGTKRIYIRSFKNNTSQKAGTFFVSGIMKIVKPNVTGGTVPYLIATGITGYTAFYTKDSLDLQNYGSELVKLKFDPFRTQLGNVDDGGDLNATVIDLEARIKSKGYVEWQ